MEPFAVGVVPGAGVGKQVYGVGEQVGQLAAHIVAVVAQWGYFRKDNVLSVKVFAVARLIEDVVAGTTNHDRLKNAVPYLVVDVVDLSQELFAREGVALLHNVLVVRNPLREGALDVGQSFDGGVVVILKEEQQIADVGRGVVERRGGEEHHLLAVALHAPPMTAGGLAYHLQVLVAHRAVVAKVVRLIHNHHVVFVRQRVVFLSAQHFVQAAVVDEPLVLDSEFLEGLLPLLAHCRRGHHQNLGEPSVGLHEPLCNHRRHGRFAQSHHIGDKATVVLEQHLVALHHGVALVGDVLEAVLGGVEVEAVLHHGAKRLHQHFHIQLVGCDFTVFEKGDGLDVRHILGGHGYTVGPQFLELLFAVVDVVIILHRHVEFVTGRIGDAQSGVGKVG